MTERKTRSETRKPHREAEDAWKVYLDRVRSVMREAKKKSLFGLDGRQFSPPQYDPAELQSLLAHCHSACESLLEIVEAIHWPSNRYDSDGSPSDESALEMAIRYLRHPDGPHSQGVEGAWGLAYQALRRYCEWRTNKHYASLGVNFGAYFMTELETILCIIEKDHLRLAGVSSQLPEEQ